MTLLERARETVADDNDMHDGAPESGRHRCSGSCSNCDAVRFARFAVAVAEALPRFRRRHTAACVTVREMAPAIPCIASCGADDVNAAADHLQAMLEEK